MTRFLQPHYLLVFGGFALGLLFGIVALDTQPALLGWIFGAGTGLMGGAFIAAIASGNALISGPEPKGDIFEGYEDLDAIEAEMPHLLDGLPPRNGAHEDDEAIPRREERG